MAKNKPDILNVDAKKKWLEALRSGEYEQGRGALQKGGMFCCLGVLCEVAVKEDIIPPPSIDVFDTATYDGSYRVTIPGAVSDWAFELRRGDEVSNLMQMNDSGKNSFSDIADYIEENM